VVALESQHWNLRDFIGLGDWSVPVAMDLSALPATQEVLGARPCLFLTPWTSLRLFTRLEQAGLLPEQAPPLGSVGLTAAALALRLTSGPLIIGGIDFSFTLDRFHARSTPSHLEGLRRQTRLCPPVNAAAAFRPGVFAAVSKSGLPVRSDPALNTYRGLFEREFGGESRLRDIAGPGLSLGVKTLTAEEAFAVLQAGSPAAVGTSPGRLAGGINTAGNTKAACDGGSSHNGDTAGNSDSTENSGSVGKGGPDRQARRSAMDACMRWERDSLITLRKILTGEEAAGAAGLETLLDECDYLWAHFPDCAGAEGKRPPGTDISFLKRVRMEIDPFIRLWDLALRDL
jgi:hypothetical protein